MPSIAHQIIRAMYMKLLTICLTAILYFLFFSFLFLEPEVGVSVKSKDILGDHYRDIYKNKANK